MVRCEMEFFLRGSTGVRSEMIWWCAPSIPGADIYIEHLSDVHWSSFFYDCRRAPWCSQLRVQSASTSAAHLGFRGPSSSLPYHLFIFCDCRTTAPPIQNPFLRTHVDNLVFSAVALWLGSMFVRTNALSPFLRMPFLTDI